MKLMLILSIICMLLVVGCDPAPTEDNSGDDGNNEAANNNENTEEEMNDDNEANEEEMQDNEEQMADDEEESMDDDSGSMGDYAKVLQELFTASMKYMVTYDMTSTFGSQEMSSTTTMYIDGPNKLRTDSVTQGIESRTFMINEELTSCNKATGDWMCNTIPQMEQQEGSADNELNDIKDNVADFDVSKVADREVAGTTAECYLIKTNQQAVVEYCFGEGIPLYVEMDGDGINVLQVATEYSKNVKDSDFDFPAEPGAIAGLPEGFVIPDV